MNLLKRIKAFLGLHRETDQTPSTFEMEIKKWFGDDGDNTHRLNYDLTADSIVFDLGGYVGDFAQKIYDKHQPNIYVFEPSQSFYEKCVDRFEANSKIKCFNFALSDENGFGHLNGGNDASSLLLTDNGATENTDIVQIRKMSEVMDELGIENVDLIKINIEGGEFDILPHLIDKDLISKFKNIQVQFHNFIEDANSKRDNIRDSLAKTHTETYCYEFVWENWKRK